MARCTASSEAVVYALFKPRKLTVARMPARRSGGTEGRRGCLTTWLTELEREAGLASDALFPIGRLDKDTSGLLLVTNDGDLLYSLTRKNACAKLYVAQCQIRNDSLLAAVAGEHAPWPAFTELARLQLCDEGVFLSAQKVDRGKIQPAATVWCESVAMLDVRTELREVPVKEDNTASRTKRLRTIEKKDADVAVSIKVGQYRVVRRVLAAIGLPVFRLRRDALGPLRIGEGELAGLQESHHVRLSDALVAELWRHVGGREALARNKAADNAANCSSGDNPTSNSRRSSAAAAGNSSTAANIRTSTDENHPSTRKQAEPY